jgi:hypothetical protein
LPINEETFTRSGNKRPDFKNRRLMAPTKEEALEHIAQVYDYAIGLSGGPNHPLARELAVWMQRHWATAGVNAANEKRRAKNIASKQPTPAPVTESSLKRFVHPKSPEAKAGEKLAPKPNAVEVLLPLEEVQESQAPRQRREKPKGLSHVAGDDTPISDSDLETIAVMKPRAILEMFGEGRITAALIGLGVTEDEMPDSGAQKAAMLKQRKK